MPRLYGGGDFLLTERERVLALRDRRSKSPSHIEDLRSVLVDELDVWSNGTGINGLRVLEAVEQYDECKAGPHGRRRTKEERAALLKDTRYVR